MGETKISLGSFGGGSIELTYTISTFVLAEGRGALINRAVLSEYVSRRLGPESNLRIGVFVASNLKSY